MKSLPSAAGWVLRGGVAKSVWTGVFSLGLTTATLHGWSGDSTSFFQDVTKSAGVHRKHSSRSFENPYAHIMEGYTALGASAAVADYNLDGYEDIFVTDSATGAPNYLYRNNGDLTFTDVAGQAGLARGNDEANASADSRWFDYNEDTFPDLLVVRFGTNQLFENSGRGTFAEVTEKAGLSRYSNAITAVAFDYDRDRDLDLFVGSYFGSVNLFNPDTPKFFPESFETASNGGGVTIYQNNGDSTFSDVTRKLGFKIVKGWTLDLGHADADNDGDEDLYIACDFGTDFFFENNGDGTFTNRTESAIGIDTKKGMNVDWADYNGDGLLDIYVTNITDDYMREGNFLWHNNGKLSFSDVSRETDTFDTGWGWAGKFFDYDLDGWTDLYVVNGWVSGSEENYVLDIFEVIVQPDIDLSDVRNWPAMGNKTLSGYQKNRLFHNERGQLFTDQAALHGVDILQDGRGVALADFNNDGRLDFFLTNADSEPNLFVGTVPLTPQRNWVEFILTGRQSTRTAIGAQIRVTIGKRVLLGFVNGGNGFASQSTRRVHFGLGTSDSIDQVEVRWPAGLVQVFPPLQANRIYRLDEGDPQPEVFQAGIRGKAEAGR